jgi:predicted small lipoprotein YifL
MKIAQLIVALSLAAGLPACGQKGPLVMPDAQKHKRTIPSLPGGSAKPAEGAPAPAPSGGSATSPPPPASAPPPAGTPSPQSTPPAAPLPTNGLGDALKP